MNNNINNIVDTSALQFRFRNVFLVLVLPLFLLACGGGSEGDAGSGTTASGRVLLLSWDPNPATDGVAGYIVYAGSSAVNATQQVTDLSVSSGVIDPNAPAVSFNAGFDLGLNLGAQVCFRLKAYNTAGLSDYSVAACATI
jgi:hypothetical protein